MSRSIIQPIYQSSFRLILFVLGFLLGFTLEVRVRASERVQLQRISIEQLRKSSADVRILAEEPKACLGSGDRVNGSCAAQVGAQRMLDLQSEKQTWTLGGGSIFIRSGNKMIRLLSGLLRVAGGESEGHGTLINTEFGSIVAEGEAFIEKSKVSVVVVNTGDVPVLLKGLGWGSAQSLAPGFEVELTRPQLADGLAAVTLPMPLDFEHQTVREAKLFSGSKSDFSDRLTRLARLRSEAAIVAADFHRKKAERKIASVNAEKKRREESRAKSEAHDRELRALFRKRVLTVE